MSKVQCHKYNSKYEQRFQVSLRKSKIRECGCVPEVECRASDPKSVSFSQVKSRGYKGYREECMQVRGSQYMQGYWLERCVHALGKAKTKESD